MVNKLLIAAFPNGDAVQAGFRVARFVVARLSLCDVPDETSASTRTHHPTLETTR